MDTDQQDNEQTIMDHQAVPLSVTYEGGIKILSGVGVGVVDLKSYAGALLVVFGATRATTQEQLEQMPTTVIPWSRVYAVTVQP